MGLVYCDKGALDAYINKPDLILKLLARVDRRFTRNKLKRTKYPNKKDKILQLTF